MTNALETPWVTLEVNDVPLSLCNDLDRPNLRMISWSSFFLTTSSDFSVWEGLQSTLWMYLSWLIGIYTLEKLTSGEVHLPVLSWLVPTSLDGMGCLGSSSYLGGCLTGKWDKETACLIVVWSPVPLKDLFSNLWRAFSPLWVVACKELTSFLWRFPGRKRSPSFWNHPIWSSWKLPSVYDGVSGKLVCGTRVATPIRLLFCNAALLAAWSAV